MFDNIENNIFILLGFLYFVYCKAHLFVLYCGSKYAIIYTPIDLDYILSLFFCHFIEEIDYMPLCIYAYTYMYGMNEFDGGLFISFILTCAQCMGLMKKESYSFQT
jgi:hypothetical protein